MGLLLPIVHDVRVTDLARLAAVFRAWGVSTLDANGCRPRTLDEVTALLGAVAAGHDTTITFARGSLPRAELACLVASELGYLAVSSPTANLRVWPEHAWVHVEAMPPGGLAAAIALLAPLGVALEPRAGTQTFGEVTVRFATPHLAIDLATPDRRAALQVFEAVAGTTLVHGYATAPSTDGRERIYTLEAAPLQRAAGWLAGYTTFWQHNLDRLKRHLEDT